mmetsp:Transcript_70068/g.121284  ORF Transcript_70068/g.121284 Transcript_70068/m.121284 type:complete len:485 (+) Transcript_70068:78-1532(+)
MSAKEAWTSTAEDVEKLAKDFKEFVDQTPTAFHCVAESVKMLKAQGYQELKERDPWCKGGLVQPGGKYYYTRNMSTIVAFCVGGKFEAGGGFHVIGAHTDTPVLKLKPCSKKSSNGYTQIAVETYGGGLWYTWFDRELSLAGCVIVAEGAGFKKRLVHVKRPLLRVPSLCIHLQSADERSSFGPNKETHLQPILTMIEDMLNKPSAAKVDVADDADEKAKLNPRHHSAILQLLAEELGCKASDIKDFDLTLGDVQPAQFWGLHNEFLSSQRLDNHVHCFTALRALLDHSAGDISSDKDISMIVCFDHEEVGSESSCGAGSPVMQEAVERIGGCFSKGDEEMHKVSIRRSFLVSADVAHAVHPNWAGKHDSGHLPLLNKGTVIKTNDQQRYATNAETGFMLREIARQGGVNVQEFVVRNDCPCGTTIGPIISSKTGMRAVDLGVPSLSMHSIRETIGVADIMNSTILFKTFFANFRTLDDACIFE